MTTRARHTTALAAGSAASGVLAYVFFAVVTRALGAPGAAPVSVLWVYWSFAGAALTFPIQHWAARAVVAHGGERPVRDALPHLVRTCAVVAVVVGAASWLLRDQLFRSGAWWFPLLAGVLTLGSAVMGLVRGVLTARREFGAVASCLVLENLVRCGVAVALYAADVRAPVAYGVALLAGYAVVVAWPAAFRLSRDGGRGDASAVALIGGAAGGQLIGQAVLTGGPVVLALAGGTSAEVTALFAGLALFRAPYTLALGVVSPVTGRLTRLVVENRVEQLRRFARSVVGLTVVGAAGAAVVGYVVGPVLLELVFGSDVTLSPGRCLVLAVGSTVAMASLVLSLGVLAHGRSLTLVRAWLVALVPGVAWFALASGELLDRTCVAFLVVEVAAFVQLPRAGLPRG